MTFSVFFHTLLVLFVATLRLPTVAGTPLNVTIRLDSPFVSFTPGWSVANFNSSEQTFAFANRPNERVQIELPPNTSAVFYQGFKAVGGALFRACVDSACDDTPATGEDNVSVVIVDAHDDTEDGTEPPETLFSFVNLDLTVSHVLTVVNLQDDRFATSQITFDSLIMTIGALEDPAPEPNPSGAGGIPTIIVTATDQQQQGRQPVTTTTATNTISATTDPTTPTPSGGENTDTHVGPSSQGNEPSVTGSAPPQPTNSSQPGQSQSATPTPTNSGTAGPPPTATYTNASSASSTVSNGNGGSQTQNPSGTGTNLPPNGGSTPPSSPGVTQTAGETSRGSSTAYGDPGSQPTAGSNTSSGAPGQPTSSSFNNNSSSNAGVSKPVIIVVAILASLIVIGLLIAIIWLLMRSQPPPPDPEGFGGLMREAASTAVISGPIGLAPMRPVNPFADPVPMAVPLHEATVAALLAQPPPRPPPPPIPPRSPLRATNPKTPTWISRIPREPSLDG